MLLFHTDVYLPECIKLKTGRVIRLQDSNLQGRMKPSQHALRAAVTDRYGLIEIPMYFDARYAKLIEIEVDPYSSRVTKRVFRQKYNDEYDLVLVITSEWVIKTVWLNSKKDLHKTLDASKYVPKPSVSLH